MRFVSVTPRSVNGVSIGGIERRGGARATPASRDPVLVVSTYSLVAQAQVLVADALAARSSE